jgi:hypothetical protein
VALARGWERQLDMANNAVFYRPGALSASSYRAWLIDNGVRMVALPDAPLDYAGAAEASLVEGGVPGLQPVWRNEHWRVYRVVGSSGIVAAPNRLVAQDNGRVVIGAAGAGPVLVRVRYSPNWTVIEGVACVERAPGGWTQVVVPSAEQVRLQLRLFASDDSRCRSSAPT